MLPQFGATPQVGFTYFCYKLCIFTMGLVSHKEELNYYTYICDRTQGGDKNSNHTMNFLLKWVPIYLFFFYDCVNVISFNSLHFQYRYMESAELPNWVRKICINMDNCGGTNKSKNVFAFFAELIRIGRFDNIYIKFMLPGHTKVIFF